MIKIINTGTGHLNNRRVENRGLLKSLNNIFRTQRSYIVKMPKKGMPVTLCLSGGIDSVSQLFILLNEFKLNVYPIFLDRKQTNRDKEIKSVKFFDNYFSKRFPKLYHKVKFVSLETPAKEYKNDLRATKELKDNPLMRRDISYPSRNPIIYLTAMEYAYSLQSKGIKIKTIFGAFPNSDYLYHSSLTALRSLNLLICHITNDWSWQVISIPIEEEFDNCYDKEIYMKYCLEKDVPLHKSRSCPKGGENHCGICIGCWDRRNAFKQIKIKDKTVYDSPFNEEIPSAYL
ncbi:MAG: 7-cyano-7-deazaguanine synthase [Bacilli bacterium]|jgi:7-cyano-7-deazaguanine synthase in queuosine biosynthesis